MPSSATAWIAPPDAAAVATASSPSAGLPIASDRASVFGRIGLTFSPVANASATGAQPSAWPPYSRGSRPSTSPTLASWEKPCRSFVKSEPEAIGQATASGSSQPSCSAISNASVFEPSA